MTSSFIPVNTGRVSMLMQSNLFLNNVRATSADLLKAQTQMTTGLRLTRPSDDPADAISIMNLDGTIERQRQYVKNMQFANDYLSAADTALGEAKSLVDQAYNFSLEGLNSGGTVSSSYASLAESIDGILSQLVTVSNRSTRNGYVFAGDLSDKMPFEAVSSGGVLFNGSLNQKQTRVADDTLLEFSISAQEAFGALSSEVVGTADMNPNIQRDTLISDLNGATGQGVRLGAIRVNDGVSVNTIDLSKCVTVGDVLDKITNETDAGCTATIAGDGKRFEIQSTAGTVLVDELGTGTTAADLGIHDLVGAGGMTLSGQDVDARLTLSTPVTALAGGAGIDLTSGLVIRNSGLDDVGPIDLSTCNTIEDVLNKINGAGVGVRAEINADGTGINVQNLLSGSRMTISENGGTTASDLGIRSMTEQTLLSDLNGGDGVEVSDGEITITASDGNSFAVQLDGATTIGDVIGMINSAATAAGVAVTASFGNTGNGIVLDDGTGGAGNFSVATSSDNGYMVARQLGFYGSNGTDGMIATGSVITGEDVNPVRADGVFTYLIDLRDALNAQDADGIAAAGDALNGYLTQVNGMRGRVGAQVLALEDRQERVEDNVLAMETLRSDLRDIDFTEAVTNYQNIYTSLQANLMSGSTINTMSLLDFLG